MIYDLSKIIVPAFHEFWRTARDGHFLYHVLKGGRNSAKSTTAGQRVITDIIELPISALVMRKVKDTIKNSVFEQLKEAVNQLHVEDSFAFYESPRRIVYKPRGNQIIFRGADKAEKIKSIKISKFPIARLWIEELPEFKTEDEVSTIVNSLLRATLPDGLEYKIYMTYNPPKRRQSWVNKKFNTANLPANTYVHHSTYLDNPYVSEQMKDEAEEVKERNNNKYRWIYMGEAIGGGVVPFDNLVFEKIPDDIVKKFDNIKEGLDWGYAVDPLAWVKIHYDKKHRKIYIFDEVYQVKLSNRNAAQLIKPRNDVIISCDWEKKSVDEMLNYGLRMKRVKKGAGSVEQGENWLDDLDAIVIDPVRCPNTAQEFESIDYKSDVHGDLLPRLEDKNNHAIDATRYAMENDMRARPSGFVNVR